MDESERINPGHATARTALRLVGPVILLIGLLFLIVGVVSFFMSMGTFGPPRYFWCVFVGMPLMFVGTALTMFGFMGAVARYQSAEVAPVGKDTANYVADGIRPAIKEMSQAVAEGFADAARDQFCAQCGQRNDADARFCKGCGKSLTTAPPANG